MEGIGWQKIGDESTWEERVGSRWQSNIVPGEWIGVGFRG